MSTSVWLYSSVSYWEDKIMWSRLLKSLLFMTFKCIFQLKVLQTEWMVKKVSKTLLWLLWFTLAHTHTRMATALYFIISLVHFYHLSLSTFIIYFLLHQKLSLEIGFSSTILDTNIHSFFSFLLCFIFFFFFLPKYLNISFEILSEHELNSMRKNEEILSMWKTKKRTTEFSTKLSSWLISSSSSYHATQASPHTCIYTVCV